MPSPASTQPYGAATPLRVNWARLIMITNFFEELQRLVPDCRLRPPSFTSSWKACQLDRGTPLPTPPTAAPRSSSTSPHPGARESGS
jgi:hypothetical protein